MPALCGANCRSSRIVSPIGVPPGSRVTRNGISSRSRRAASRRTCVDFPQPSDPSNVINGPRGMISLARRHSVFQAPNPNIQARENLQLPRSKNIRAIQSDLVIGDWLFSGYWNLEFGTYEILLARETGAVLLLVVGLHQRPRNKLEGRSQLRCAK